MQGTESPASTISRAFRTGMEPVIVADPHPDARPGGLGCEARSSARIESPRLLDQHMLAGADGRQRIGASER